MDQPILIRAQEPGDIPALTEVFNQPRAVWGTLQRSFVSVAARQKRFADAPDASLYLVAEIEGRVIGSGSLDPYPATQHRRRHAATLGMVAHDDFTGRGAGRALLGALIDQADRWLNLKRLELTVWADNDRAVALYEQAGFEREGLLRSYAWRDGAYVDALCMARLNV